MAPVRLQPAHRRGPCLRPLLRAATTALGFAALAALASAAAAQTPGLTLPPDGENQRSTATQQIGMVQVSIAYSSPDVHGPTGEDRRGKIWGQLVPYGMGHQDFGTCGDNCPWRGGANENTVFTTSHDVQVQGQPLPAGSYGLHFIPGQEEWTIIFSQDHTSWGSFFYEEKEDALRVKAKPEKSDYHEWLTYEFTDRRPDRATLALMWEDLKLPFTVTVPDPSGLYLANIRRELRNSNGFTWQTWNAAAQYALQNKGDLKEALKWAENATALPFIGEENFVTLLTLSQLQAANGLTAEAGKTLDKALGHRTAGPGELHTYARQLMTQKKTEEAVRVWETNAKRFPGVWPVEVGLARARMAQSKRPEAIAHLKKALAQAPNEAARRNVEALIQQLEKGEEI